METKELKIQIPDGYCIDESESTFEKIVFKRIRPRSWEEYVNNYIISGKEYYIGTNSTIYNMNPDCIGSKFPVASGSKNWIPTKELAEAFLAMMQLMSLRKAWIGDCEPDWNPKNPYDYKYCISSKGSSDFIIAAPSILSAPLSFPSREMATDFMNCFKDLLNVARPLI